MHPIAQRYIRDAEARGRMGRQPGSPPPIYHNFVDDYNIPGHGHNFVGQPRYMMAAGDQTAMPVKPSQSYSIIISSASAAAVANFDVFGASTYLNNAQVTFDPNGNLVIGAITISSNTSNVTYRDLLQQSAWQPFTVGQTYMQCSSPASQILVPYTITTKDSNGTLIQLAGKPKKDPYQQQNDVLVDPTVYSIDGLSKITFSQILPFAVLMLDFYPQSNINTGRLLNGQIPGKDYGNPGIIRSNVAVIPAGGGGSNFAGGGGPGGYMIRTRY